MTHNAKGRMGAAGEIRRPFSMGEGKMASMPRRPKAFSYYRFSSPEQGKGDSIRRQSEAAERYAAANGLTLDRSLTLKDEGLSAYTGRNIREGSALGAFLDAVNRGRVPRGSILLVESLDRLSRQTARKALRTLEQIIEAGVDVVTLTDGKRYDVAALDGMDLLMAMMVMVRAHEESSTKSARVKASWAARRKKYGPDAVVPGQRAPFYIAVDPRTRKQSIDARKGKVAKRIASEYVSGRPLREIVRGLNGDRVPSPQGAAWSRVQLTRTLRALATRDGPSPLDRSQRTRLRSTLTRRRSEGRPRTDGETSILRGLGRCGYCRAPLQYERVPKKLAGGKTRTYEYLRCGTNAERPGQCEGPSHLHYNPVAGAVVELAGRVAENPPPTSRKLAASYRTAQAEADRLVQRAEAMTETWEGNPTRETAGRVREAWLEAQRANDAAETALALARPGFSTVDGETLKNAASDAAMNAALRAFLDRVEVRAGRAGEPSSLTFHYSGGGEIGLKYTAKVRSGGPGKPKAKAAD